MPEPRDMLPPDPAYGFAAVCAWCQRAGVLHILKLRRRDTDVVIIHWHGAELVVYRNAEKLQVSHGMCAEHRAAALKDAANGSDEK